MSSDPVFAEVERIAMHVCSLVTPKCMSMVTDYISVNEYGVAVETLLDYLVEEEVRIEPADALALADASAAMRSDRWSRAEIESLATATATGTSRSMPPREDGHPESADAGWMEPVKEKGLVEDVLRRVEQHMRPAAASWVREFIAAGEMLIAVESICEELIEYDVRLAREDALAVADASEAVGAERYPRTAIEALVRPPHVNAGG